MSHAFPGSPAPTANPSNSSPISSPSPLWGGPGWGTPKRAAALFLLLTAAAPLPDPSGDWFTEDKRGIITIAPCGDSLCGAITGISDWDAKGQGPRDVHGTPECQLRFIHDMKPADDNRRHGTVTDPTDGKIYQAQLWLSDDGVLNLRGYIGLPILGSTQHWTRFTGKRTPDCHFTK